MSLFPLDSVLIRLPEGWLGMTDRAKGETGAMTVKRTHLYVQD
jgi:hypothetical protein